MSTVFFDIPISINSFKEERAITTYSFEVSDSILNIGPCGMATIGEPPFLSEEFEANSKETAPDLELVLTSGHGKNGALTILQRAIRPQVENWNCCGWGVYVDTS